MSKRASIQNNNMTASVVDIKFKVTRVSYDGNTLKDPYSRVFLLESLDLNQTISQLPRTGRFANLIVDIKKAFPETMETNGSATKFKLVSPGKYC